MSTATDRLAELGLELPPVAAPVAAYVPAVTAGNQIVTSGQLPMKDGALRYTGKVGAGVTVDDAKEAARLCVLNALAAAAIEACGIDAIRVVKIVVFVASAPDFTGQPQVANGASELLESVFGERHARSAVGVAVLPLDAPVEIELTAEIV